MWRINESGLEQTTKVAGALADPGRVRVLCALRPGEVCVCQIVELLGLAPSTVSKHLLILREAGLILGRKEGKWMYYRLPGDDAPPIVREALAWIFAAAGRSQTVRDDVAQMRTIMRVDPVQLCCRQRGVTSC